MSASARISTAHGYRSQLGNAAGLPALVEVMRERQYGDALIEKLCFRNWLRVLERTWK